MYEHKNKIKMEKTHWLQSPNKNYLGHWDLPESEDLVLTIESAQWEEVKNPIINQSEAKRVIRFKEDVKPLICNQTNAQSIVNSTGVKFMEDSQGCQIALYISQIKDRKTKDMIDCIRIRNKFEQTAPRKPLISDERFQKALKSIEEGTYTIEKLKSGFTFTEEQQQLIDAV